MSSSKNGKAHLVLLSPKTHMKQRLDILRKMEKGRNIIYVSITNSCDKLAPLITKQGILQEQLFFIGCGKPHSDTLQTNCVHCPSPNALLSLSILIVETVKIIPGRMEKIDEGQNFTVLVDYAHEKESITNVLQTANNMKIGGTKTIILLGAEGGGRDKAKRPIMGELAAKMADYVIVSNVDPYEDDPKQILEDIAISCEKFGKIRGIEIITPEQALKIL